MTAIESAYKGRVAMLRAIFGGDDPPPEKPVKSKQEPLSQQLARIAPKHSAAKKDKPA